MSKRTIVTVVVVIVGLAIFGVGYWLAAQNGLAPLLLTGSPMTATVVSTETLTAVPDVVSGLFDFSRVHTYEITKTTYQNGEIEYSLKFNTSHLQANFNNLEKGMIEDNGFALEQGDLNNGQFDMTFKKGGSVFRAVGIPDARPGTVEPSTVWITFRQAITSAPPDSN